MIPSTEQDVAAFGYSITHTSEWLLVGAKDDSTSADITGAAYFFKLENEIWIEKQKVISDKGAAGDLFGISVSMSGDYAVVTANGDDSHGSNTGAAFVYKNENNVWVFKQKLLPHSGSGFDEYGIGVSMVGDLMVVGAYSDFENGQFSGAAYIYSLEDGVWLEEAKIFPDDGSSEDKFGRSVNTDGEKVIVCGVLNDDSGMDSGSAYIFSKHEGDWLQEVKLLAPDGEENDRFGRSVSIDGEYAAVGSVLDDDNGESSGSVYVYHNEFDGWRMQTKITPTDGQAGDFFGYSLAMNGRYLVVGAHNDDNFGMNSGSAYLFTRLGITWSETEKFNPEVQQEGANFAESVNIDDTWISFGAPYYLTSNGKTGAAFTRPAPMPLGVIEEKLNSFKAYPNPALNRLYLDNLDSDFELTILNATGRTITNWKYLYQPNLGTATIDISSLDSGVYVIQVKAKSGYSTSKFLKL